MPYASSSENARLSLATSHSNQSRGSAEIGQQKAGQLTVEDRQSYRMNSSAADFKIALSEGHSYADF